MPKPSDIPAKPKPVKRDNKKPFVRKPHLTDRALKNHPDLIELKKHILPRDKKEA